MTGSTLSFDVVVATLGRTTELAALLASLETQTYRNFTVVVVDQNADGRLESVLDRFGSSFAIVRLTSEPGLSRARNAALRELAGDVVCFPDDDCRYPPDLLRAVAARLEENLSWAGVAGRTVDEAAGSSFLPWQKDAGLVTRENVWRTAVAATLFLRRAVVERVGFFDETLGAGSGTRWGSGEETDYVLRALEARFTIGYDPALTVVHASPDPPPGPAPARKAYLTGRGNSRVLRAHGYPATFAAYRVAQATAGSAYFLVRGRPALARFYWAMARGRAAEWFHPSH